ncbi:hypothetical protein K469DRAFT_722393 [Zopfia rhizophila CBS 207.26]|uniref:Uncharacterized protein n=1 Tax=Zopfia rhizophila CBS 207.26 TaxID=1314779 RepID=A0A6A6ESD4_9PEZI|nr:hypothetical protein K469DRAFT_722393 [Zopfia rhizophila CBS 207.26]
MTKKNILAGWAKTGLFPFNPDRVLRDITKPAAELPTALSITKDSGPFLRGEVVQTPVTPVLSEALTSLLTLIKQDPHDEKSAKRHPRLVQKLANAAEISFAQQALNQDQIQFLSKINDEAKTRRKTKSEILGKARAEAIANKGKCKKRKRATQEAEEVQTSGTHIAEVESAPQPYRAPVARMW